jgi:hypothetical protein
MCRWALDVNFPLKVSSTGGRFHYDDSWEAFDTQLAGYEFPGGKTIHREGRSCNVMPVMNRGRGCIIHGTEGSVLMERGGYIVYGPDGKEIRNQREGRKQVSMGTAGGGSLDELHIGNFIRSVNSDEALKSPIDDANPSVTICHLGNMAQRAGGSFHCDPETGKPTDDHQAMELWGREYAPGWEPVV